MKLAICDDSTQEKNLKDFLGNWPLSRVRTMPLSDYTRVNNQSGNEFKDSYCYALEHLTPVGIGGANSLKFQIYEFKNESKIKHTNSDSRYAWHNSLGSTAEVAYSKIRDLIIRVIEAAQASLIIMPLIAFH
jgi:5-methylcytosine-specific restriction protein B